ncbi:MAG: hypothetical protein B7Y36_18285 [Novosphingobium sp. 28-62-57]|uniref:hypothetical protein n=1 Tax=unclassified Novosphingobium TaxID=2644732 RepID=UPI000BC4E4CA|nr:MULTISPECIES: hypothetical protein [unclassified Novosphingobium]OYW47317.1 MAG: hypothetical protein B7Z36_03895 [Novosphingobium sp. 12-63-9]OYZ07985.1 MAG: hypothetical protein B7Y36_18285 [Novosphingobium sp. 28-62-57]HQS69260.1 hypothetical protein [Novosphingobium sp.]
MPRKPASLAERYRAHRAAFELAQQLGCTPKEAEAELARRAARKDWLERNARLEALKNAPLHPIHRPIHRADPEPPPQPYWLRD